MYKCVSLFSGCGGGDLGFTKAGFEIVFSNDIYVPAINTQLANFEHHISGYGTHFYVNNPDLLPPMDVIIGGPPCKSFSNAKTTADGKFNAEGLNNVIDMKKIIELKQPKMYVMENVPAVLNDRLSHVYQCFTDMPGYKVNVFILKTEEFGIPQIRERAFFVGIRNDLPYIFRQPVGTHWNKLYSGWAEYLGLSSNHLWRKRSGSPYVAEFDKPVWTITTADQPIVSKRFYNGGIPIETGRGYAPVEYIAALQGFPKDFVFCGNKTQIYTQIGNAWSVNVAEALGKEVRRCLDFYATNQTGIQN